jgi:hypothetical protein
MEGAVLAYGIAQRFADYLVAGRAAHVAQDELIGRTRYRFAHSGGREAFSEGGGGGFGGLFRRGCKNGLTELVNPVVFGGAEAGGSLQEFLFFEQFGQELPRRNSLAPAPWG